MIVGWDRCRVGGGCDLNQGVGGGTWVWYYYIVVGFFFCAFLFCSFMSCLFLSDKSMIAVVFCFFVYYIFSLSLVPLTRTYLFIKIVVSFM